MKKLKFLVLKFDFEAIKSTEKFKEYFAEVRKNRQFNNQDEYIIYSTAYWVFLRTLESHI